MIGLIGGIGPFATARYYEGVVAGYRRRTGRYPEIVIVSLDFGRFTQLEDRPDREPYVAEIVDGLGRLAAAGARLAAMTANSPHAVLDRIEARAPLPLVSILDPVARSVRRHRFRRLLLLGISATVRADLYQTRLAEAGAEILVPTPAEQDRVDAIVFEELGDGVARPSSRDAVRAVIRRHPADAVVLGCTELPLLLGPDDVDVPLVDTLALHVDAIVRRASDEERREPPVAGEPDGAG